MMTAKDYLSQYKYLDAEINLKQEEKKRLEELAESTASANYPGGSGVSDKVGKGAGNIVDLQKEIDNLKALKSNIEGVIKAVENPKYRLILTMKYINCKRWSDISNVMHINDKKWLYKLHKRALKSVIIS